jgi:hypothetical protein
MITGMSTKSAAKSEPRDLGEARVHQEAQTQQDEIILSRGHVTLATLKGEQFLKDGAWKPGRPKLFIRIERPLVRVDGKPQTLPIRMCADCGDIFHVHDVSEYGSSFGSCGDCQRKSEEKTDRASWRDMLLEEENGPILIKVMDAWVARINRTARKAWDAWRDKKAGEPKFQKRNRDGVWTTFYFEGM